MTTKATTTTTTTIQLAATIEQWQARRQVECLFIRPSYREDAVQCMREKNVYSVEITVQSVQHLSYYS